MIPRPFILITNDDGIESPGLHAAIEALQPLAELLITAPADQQTAAGSCLRAAPEAVFESRVLHIDGAEVTGWCLRASPATTVRHALQCLCGGRVPDMVVSGINFGENLGTNVVASGTVGAALQAASHGIRSLAVSLEVPQEFHYEHGEVDWSQAIRILRDAVDRLLPLRWPEDVDIIKIDIPDNAVPGTPWRVCRQSREPGWWGFVPDAGPGSAAGTTIGRRGPRPGFQWHEGDDMSVLLGRREVAVTPLSIELTSRVDLATVRTLLGT